MPTHEAAIVAEARRVARLQARKRKLAREMRVCVAELKMAKRNLRAMADRLGDPFDQAPPLRMFDERTGTE